MARIKFGAIVTDMRGKLGGHVFQKGNQSRVMKTGSVPRAVDNQFVRDGKERLSSVQAEWRGLSVADKARWQFFATQNPQFNVFSDPITLTGLQYYTKLASAYIRTGYVFPLSIVGFNVEPNPYNFTSCDLNITTNVASIQGNSLPAGSSWQLWVVRLPNESVKVAFGKFVWSRNVTVNSIGTSTPNFTLEQRFGALTVNDVVYMAAVPVSVFGVASAPRILRSNLSS